MTAGDAADVDDDDKGDAKPLNGSAEGENEEEAKGSVPRTGVDALNGSDPKFAKGSVVLLDVTAGREGEENGSEDDVNGAANGSDV